MFFPYTCHLLPHPRVEFEQRDVATQEGLLEGDLKSLGEAENSTVVRDPEF